MCELTKHSANFIFLIPILLDLKTYQKIVHHLNMNGRTYIFLEDHFKIF